MAASQVSIPDLTGISRRNGGTFPDDMVRKIVSGESAIAAHGSREMPVWGARFQENCLGPGSRQTLHSESDEVPAITAAEVTHGRRQRTAADR